MKKFLMIITAIVMASFYVVAKRKSRRGNLEEAEFLHCEKDSPIKRGELL